MVTAGTYHKEHYFRSPEMLSLLQDHLLSLADEYQWLLQAWAILSNHYHFVAHSEAAVPSLQPFIRHLHSLTARGINGLDHVSGRKVWFQYWESQITFQRSYLARLKYVHSNAVHHRLVRMAEDYPWCSARWFRGHASASFCKVVYSMPVDKLSINDDF